MNMEDIRDRARRSTQTPLFIRLTDGQVLVVRHPEFMGFPQKSGSFDYFSETGGVQIISLDQVVTLDAEMPQQTS